MVILQGGINMSEKEAAQILVNDLVLLADKCKQAIDVAHFLGEDSEKAYIALTLCEQVLDKWTQK